MAFLAGHGLGDLDMVPGLQPVEEPPGHGPVLEGRGHHEPLRSLPGVIEVGKGDVRPGGRGMAEELVDGARPVGEVDGKLRKPGAARLS
jgi:hypothetical protein